MTVHGKIKNGKVLLDDPKALPEGTVVVVRPARKSRRSAKSAKLPDRKKSRSLAERLASVRGQAKGLPPDASVNHDHYLYGLPKQE